MNRKHGEPNVNNKHNSRQNLEEVIQELKRASEVFLKASVIAFAGFVISNIALVSPNHREKEELGKLQTLVQGVNYENTKVKLVLGGYAIYGKHDIPISILGTNTTNSIVFDLGEIKYYPITQKNDWNIILHGMSFVINTTKVRDWVDKYIRYKSIGKHDGVEIFYSGSYPFLINHLPSEITLTIKEFRKNKIPLRRLFYLDQSYPKDERLLKNTEQLTKKLPEIVYHDRTDSAFIHHIPFIYLPEDVKGIVIRLNVDRLNNTK